jgi:hypothetical protein
MNQLLGSTSTVTQRGMNMLPIAPLVAPLILPIAHKIIDTLGGTAKNTVNTLLDPVTPGQNNNLPTKNKITF